MRTYSQAEIIMMEINLNLPILRDIQNIYPTTFVGGSLGLFLHGIRLKRFLDVDKSDIDIILPYFILLSSGIEEEISSEEQKNSGNDFNTTIKYKGSTVDIKINPSQPYEIIEYKGYKYRIARLEDIWAAKLKYILNRQSKHKDDLYEICGKIN